MEVKFMDRYRALAKNAPVELCIRSQCVMQEERGDENI
jgi:hypothetical protein